MPEETEEAVSNIIPLDARQLGHETRDALVAYVAQQIDGFIANGGEPTAVAFVVADDRGAYRTGWHAEVSALPGGAVVGYLLASLISGCRENEI